MAYEVGILPAEYNQVLLQEELRKIQIVLNSLEIPMVYLIPQHVEPARLYAGLVANADGTDWNPGAGAGLYEYTGAAWSKL